MPRRSTRSSTRNRRSNRPIRAARRRRFPEPRVVRFVPKEEYKTRTTSSGLLILSKRKHAFLTEEEKQEAAAAKRQKASQVKKKKLSVLLLRHKVAALWEHGCCMDGWIFPAKNCKKIIEFFQATYPQYEQFASAKSFVYRAVKRHKLGVAAGDALELDPMRDRRGENRRSTKRKNAAIVDLCDRLLSEDKTSCPKVQRSLRARGFNVSTKTIQRIAKDLDFLWTKPWHTDVLTPAQKKKREIFCRNLLTLTEQELLQRLSGWLWSDEKWWDIVGPAASQWRKAKSKLEAKRVNQVFFYKFYHLNLLDFVCFLLFLFNFFC